MVYKVTSGHEEEAKRVLKKVRARSKERSEQVERVKREEFTQFYEGLCKDLEGRPEEHLVRAIGFYLVSECRVNELTLANLIMLICADAYVSSADDYEGLSPLGILFKDLSKKTPDHVVIKHYADYHKAMSAMFLSPKAFVC